MEPWRRDLYSDELYHYGVKGMRWGVRRYQNRNGTLTPAGRKLRSERKDVYRKKYAELEDKRGLVAAINKAVAYDDKHGVLVDNDPRSESGKNWKRVNDLMAKVNRESEAFADEYIRGKYGQRGLDAIKKYDESATRAFLKFFGVSD